LILAVPVPLNLLSRARNAPITDCAVNRRSVGVLLRRHDDRVLTAITRAA
jgi:hypothetical protein